MFKKPKAYYVEGFYLVESRITKDRRRYESTSRKDALKKACEDGLIEPSLLEVVALNSGEILATKSLSR